MLFRKGDTVVHPEHGAAVIEDIRDREFQGETRKYLKLRVVHGDLTVNVPVPKKGAELATGNPLKIMPSGKAATYTLDLDVADVLILR